MNETTRYEEVLKANVALHSRMADAYNSCEPHFRPENKAKVENILSEIIAGTSASKMLDLGCGTGFLINLGKKYLKEIHGIDATQAMLDKVDTSGAAKIILHNHDTGSFPVQTEYFDIVTAYSFLHHLYDINPTIKTAFNALKSGGIFYADLEPNYYFWEKINALGRQENYDQIVKREIEAVTYKDEDIEKNFGVDKQVFNNAEYGKNIIGGFKEAVLKKQLTDAGFRDIKYEYHWYLGQGWLINNDRFAKNKRFEYAEVMDDVLQRALPLSKHLYKYIRFMAIK